MQAVVSRDALITLIEPIYPKMGGQGEHPPCPLATMLRIHLQQ
jgi:IS5 family transposase